MIDFVLGLAFAGVALRGWLRGFVRAVMDLVGLVGGIYLGVRFSEPAGQFFASWTGLGAGASRVLGGMTILFGFGLAAALAASALGKVMRLPGLNLANRIGGSALSFAWAWLFATIIVSVAVLMPLPEEWDVLFEESSLVASLTDEAQPVQVAIRALTDDDTLQSALNFDDLIGLGRTVLEPAELYELVVTAPEELGLDAEAQRGMLDLVNAERVGAGLAPLEWHERISDVAQAYARRMAVGGFFGHTAPEGDSIGDRVEAAGIPYRVVGENLAVAVTMEMAHEGLMESEGHRANILNPEFTSMGVGLVETPYGVVIVQVFHA
ncbi:MAG: hypothetical protein HKN46_02150 [Acidimicrobiia bacterium]|nr:hypothetical protein [Acidimicrobiia bacterium]